MCFNTSNEYKKRKHTIFKICSGNGKFSSLFGCKLGVGEDTDMLFLFKKRLNVSEQQTVTSLYLCVYLWPFPQELHFHSACVFSCPLFSEHRRKELALIHVPIQCHDSRALRCRQFAVVWLTVDHRTTRRNKRDTPQSAQENKMTKQSASPRSSRSFFTCRMMTHLSDTSAARY